MSLFFLFLSFRDGVGTDRVGSAGHGSSAGSGSSSSPGSGSEQHLSTTWHPHGWSVLQSDNSTGQTSVSHHSLKHKGVEGSWHAALRSLHISCCTYCTQVALIRESEVMEFYSGQAPLVFVSVFPQTPVTVFPILEGALYFKSDCH